MLDGFGETVSIGGRLPSDWDPSRWQFVALLQQVIPFLGRRNKGPTFLRTHCRCASSTHTFSGTRFNVPSNVTSEQSGKEATPPVVISQLGGLIKGTFDDTTARAGTPTVVRQSEVCHQLPFFRGLAKNRMPPQGIENGATISQNQEWGDRGLGPRSPGMANLQ